MVRIDAAIIGGQKCGTTSLYRALAQHADVFAPSAKESRAFTLDDDARDRTLRHRYRHASRLTLHAYAHAWAVPGVMSSMYRHNPNMRLVALTRDPVDRVWSAYHFARKNGWETLDIHAALAAEHARRGGSRIERVELQYVANSRYDVLISGVVDVFGAEALRVVPMTQLGEMSSVQLAPIYDHLGLPAAEQPGHRRQNVASTPRFAPVHRLALGESSIKRWARSVLPTPLKQRIHQHLVGPVLRWNTVHAPLPAVPDAVRDDVLSRLAQP